MEHTNCPAIPLAMPPELIGPKGVIMSKESSDTQNDREQDHDLPPLVGTFSHASTPAITTGPHNTEFSGGAPS
jgi:hypothetical protein